MMAGFGGQSLSLPAHLLARSPPCDTHCLPVPCAVGMFTPAEIDDIIAIGYLNGLFVLARSAGLIGGSSAISLCQQWTLIVWHRSLVGR